MDDREELQEENIQQQKQPTQWKARPAWQVWGARIVLVIFVVFLFMYYVNLMRGGR